MLRLHDPYNSHDDELVNEYMMKDGGPIPILEMTYINKTQPKPCDKEVYLYELQETVLEKMGRPLQGILRNCHDSKCERWIFLSFLTSLLLSIFKFLQQVYTYMLNESFFDI